MSSLKFLILLLISASFSGLENIQADDQVAPKKVRLLRETSLQIQLGTIVAYRKVPPNTEVDVIRVSLPNLEIRQTNATAIVPADTTDFFERTANNDAPDESRNVLKDPPVSSLDENPTRDSQLEESLKSPEPPKRLIVSPKGRTPRMKLWVDKKKSISGLKGTYFDRKLGVELERDLNLVSKGVSRIDRSVDFEFNKWGNLRKMNPGQREKFRWKDFTVQWEGWVELDGPGRLILQTVGGSRMWIDANGDGEFGESQDEAIDNGWGGKRNNRSCSGMLSAGVYRILIHYEGAHIKNSAKLLITNGFIDYRDFNRITHQLFPWEGKNVMLLTESADHDPELIARLIQIFDTTFDYFVRVSGRKPSLYYTLNNKPTIAEVPKTCGAGCGMIGATGIEMTRSSFAGHLKDLQQDGTIRSLIMWEFGRNFFFYDKQMRYQKPDGIGIKNTFADVMRTLAFRDQNLPMQPFMVKVSESHEKLLKSYIDDELSNFDNTLRVNESSHLTKNEGWKLLAAMIIQLHRDYGGEKFITRFWQTMARQPHALTTQDAVDNFARAASIAAERNLVGLFRGPWKLPVSDSAANALFIELGAPVMNEAELTP
jgi:hypothetical protein